MRWSTIYHCAQITPIILISGHSGRVLNSLPVGDGHPVSTRISALGRLASTSERTRQNETCC